MLSHTSTEWAPWYVIPADRKWFARIAVGAVLVHTLMEIDPRFPRVTRQRRDGLLEVKQTLEAQAPARAAPDPVEQRQPAATAPEAARVAGRRAEAGVAAKSSDGQPAPGS
jgi:hypothetical protein